MQRPYRVIRFPRPTTGGNETLVTGPTATPTIATPPRPAPFTIDDEDLTLADAQKASEGGDLPVPKGLPMSLIAPLDVTAAAASTSAWGLDAVKATTSSRTGAGTVVAVLDTGCDIHHPAFAHLAAANRIEVKNFTAGADDDVTDHHGHGTHCAGTICGQDVNGERIGVAPGIDKLVIGKVLGPGGGTSDVILEAMLWALGQGAHVVSMSLGIDFPGWVKQIVNQTGMDERPATSRALHDYRVMVNSYEKLAQFLADQDVLVVAATGNESNRPAFTIDVSPPAAASTILRVGAVGRNGAAFGVADFSNTGPTVVAPGVDVLSAKAGGGLTSMSGTSMATPHVAGVAALWREHLLASNNGAANHQALEAQVLASAIPVPATDFDDVGNGLVTCPP